MNFIKQKDTMIVWNVNPEDYNEITEFYVYEWTDKDREECSNFGKQPLIRYQKCGFSYGNCLFDFWNNLTIEDLACECLKILFEYKNTKDIKKCLLELCKIEELECVRKMTYHMFERGITFKEFEEKYYG